MPREAFSEVLAIGRAYLKLSDSLSQHQGVEEGGGRKGEGGGGGGGGGGRGEGRKCKFNVCGSLLLMCLDVLMERREGSWGGEEEEEIEQPRSGSVAVVAGVCPLLGHGEAAGKYVSEERIACVATDVLRLCQQVSIYKHMYRYVHVAVQCCTCACMRACV